MFQDPPKRGGIFHHGMVATRKSAAIENHHLTTYHEVLREAAKPVQPLALRIDNQIPIGKGCGSSAAARLAGIALAVHFGRLKWTDSRIVGEASRREHHPDNAAACWMGGLAVARMLAESEAQVASIIPKGKWPLLLAVPDEALPTEGAPRTARAIFPGRRRLTFRFHAAAGGFAAAATGGGCARRPCSPIPSLYVRYCRRCKAHSKHPEFRVYGGLLDRQY
jgi:homoserine kinase